MQTSIYLSSGLEDLHIYIYNHIYNHINCRATTFYRFERIFSGSFQHFVHLHCCWKVLQNFNSSWNLQIQKSKAKCDENVGPHCDISLSRNHTLTYLRLAKPHHRERENKNNRSPAYFFSFLLVRSSCGRKKRVWLLRD
jgi:hypothetical protein